MRRQVTMVARCISLTLLSYGGICLGQSAPLETPPARQSQSQPPSSPKMGVATGTAHAPVKDSKSRPSIAGGFVDDAPVVYLDVTTQAGLDTFHHRMGTAEKSKIIEATGSGVALLDYDNDGWLRL